ncbi:helix-turn-helix transcriptional regulator [Deinococcus petrolearius]|uniref:Helix-turn-helix transcriptional regulator n=1 Tax=Deinococcus petrolearius TaxID=1751295 RepID=A0ABW1DMN7_9DEIO
MTAILAATPPVPGGLTERTKHRLLDLVKRHGPLTAQDLAARLEVSVPATRRHLGDLQEQGLVEARTERPSGRGRPQHVYALTERGEGAFPKTYSGLCVDVLRHVAALFGEDAVTRVLASRTAEQARVLGAELPAALPAHVRAEVLARHLSEQGYDAVVDRVVEGGQETLYLVERNCPHLAVARQFPELCAAELTLYGELLGTAVTRETRIACGQGCCRYRVG